MIHVKDLASKIQKYLHEKGFDDFKIFIRINFSIDVFVFTEDKIASCTIRDDFWAVMAEDEDDFYQAEKDHIN